MKQEKILNLFKKLLGWPFALIALFFIIKIIAPKTILLLPHFKNINFLELFFGLISFVAYFFLRGFMWHTILKFKGHFLPFGEAVFLWGYSELKRYIPGSIWSFLGRTISFNDRGIEKKEIISALIIEAEFIVLGSAFLSIFSYFIFKDLFPNPIYQQLIIVIILSLLVIFTFHQIFFKFIDKKFLKYLLPNFSPQQNLLILVISIITFSLFGLGTYLVGSSLFYLNFEYIVGFVGFFVFSLLIGYLSIIAPMGLGVRETIMTVGLSKLMQVELAGLISIFSRIIFIISEAVFLLIAFIWMNLKKRKTLL